jgi:ADP-ribose pyrophosphatase
MKEYPRPKRLSRKLINHNRWFTHYHDAVELPTGTIWEEYHFLDFPLDSVAVVVENEAGDLLMVYQYRYTLDLFQWEVVAGGAEKGESPEAAAAREVLEETGYHTVNHQLLYSFTPVPGIGNKVHHVVRCRATTNTGTFDHDEICETGWFSQERVREMVAKREFLDGFTLTAFLLYFSML